MTRKLEITLEQAKELLVSMPSLTEVIYSNFPELKPKPLVPDSYADLEPFEGYATNANSQIFHASPLYPTSTNLKFFATKKQAKSAIAYAQLTQLMRATGDCDIDWILNNEKYCIIRIGNRIGIETSIHSYQPIAFKTKKIRDEFFDKHQDLLKQFFQLD